MPPSNSSSSIRQKLKSEYCVVPDVSNSIAYTKYEEIACQMYEKARSSHKHDLNATYIFLLKFLILVGQKLPKHKDHQQHLWDTRWRTIIKNALDFMDTVQAQMDEIEDAKLLQKEDENTYYELIDEFEDNENDNNFENKYSKDDNKGCRNSQTPSTPVTALPNTLQNSLIRLRAPEIISPTTNEYALPSITYPNIDNKDTLSETVSNDK